MIRFQRITTADAALYGYMERLMQASFPAEEYRDLAQLRLYTDARPQFCNNVILLDEVPVGLFTYWDFGDFLYAEHFAVDPARRNGGVGRDALRQWCAGAGRPVVLEVEMPEDEMARRRVGFYERQGFSLWPNDYEQPPYRPGDGYLPMRLMAYGGLDSQKDYDRVVARIYSDVYGVPVCGPR